jgi:hypothetical protein
MTDVVAAMTAEVLVPLGEAEAKVLDNKITSTFQAIGDRKALVARYLTEAANGLIHKAFGFDSWPAYVEDRCAGKWSLKGEERQGMAQLLASHGMSTSVIAAITGSSKATAARDVAAARTVSNETVDNMIDAGLAESESPDATVSNETVEPSAVITSRDGSKRQRPKNDQPPSAPNPRKVVERMAPRIDGLATAFDGLDPNEVDPDALGDKVSTIRESVGKITAFIDQVSPPKQPVEPEDDEPARKPQIPTVVRRNVAEVTELLKEVDRLRMDTRWGKSAERFKIEDRIAVKVAMTLLSNLDKTLGGDGMPSSADPFDGIVLSDGGGVHTPDSKGDGDEEVETLGEEAPSVVRPSPASMPRKA